LCPGLLLGELRVTGGGEKSALWNQIKSDVVKIPVVQITNSEGAPMGAALLAAYAVGLVKDIDAGARQWVAAGSVTRPNSRAAACYEGRLRRYESLLRALNSWPQDTSTMS
jgi:xylulokinase